MASSERVHETTVVSPAWSAGRMNVNVYEDQQAMGSAAATLIAQQIADLLEAKELVRMVFAAAPSQAEMISSLLAIKTISWERVTAFHMDDYLDLPPDAPQRFANWLETHLFSKASFGTVHRIPAIGNAEEICADYATLLAAAPIDIACLGIGVNGHIAFNDPPVADFDDPAMVKVVELDDTCRQQQVDDGCFEMLEDVPNKAITLTVPQLMAAEAIYCVVPGSHKRNAVEAALHGPISTACPASVLRSHPNCCVFLDREASPRV
jgi:glucosamine-6-phosphate deaminase